MLYLDTSILVSALTSEPRTQETQLWLTRQAIDQLWISDWTLTEFSSALSLKLRTRQLNEQQRSNALSAFNRLAEVSLSVLSLERRDFQTAARFADHPKSGLRAGDALHLAIASHHGAHLISLDKVLVRAAQQLGIRAALL